MEPAACWGAALSPHSRPGLKRKLWLLIWYRKEPLARGRVLISGAPLPKSEGLHLDKSEYLAIEMSAIHLVNSKSQSSLPGPGEQLARRTGLGGLPRPMALPLLKGPVHSERTREGKKEDRTGWRREQRGQLSPHSWA